MGEFLAQRCVRGHSGRISQERHIVDHTGSQRSARECVLSLHTYILLTRTRALVQDDWKDRFVLTAEDYLHGVISVVNELVRTPMSLNSALRAHMMLP